MDEKHTTQEITDTQYEPEDETKTEPKSKVEPESDGDVTEVPKKKRQRTKQTMQLTVVAALSVLFILGGCVGLLLNGVLGRIDRTEITGNPSADLQSHVSALEEEDWINEMLKGEEGNTSEPTASGGAGNANSNAQVSSGESAYEKAQKLIEAKIAESKAQHQAVQGLEPLSGNGIQNILLIGADNSGIGDTNILVTINRNTGKIHLTSFMRAMYVNIPGRTWHMLNHAYAWGGPKLTMQTIEDNFRVKVDDYAVVSFSNFTQVINAVGGVDITLTAAEAEYLTNEGYPCEAGTQRLNGSYALAYCRIRYIDSDFKRTNRQRDVIEAVLRSAMQMNPADMYALAGELAGMVNTSLTTAEILQLATEAPKLLGYKIDQKMLPVENDTSNGQAGNFSGRIFVPYAPGSTNRIEVYAVNYDKNVAALRDYLQS